MLFVIRQHMSLYMRGFAVLMIAACIAGTVPQSVYAVGVPGVPNNNHAPDTVECQSGWFDISGKIACALMSVVIFIIAAVLELFTTVMYWADDLFSYAIASTIVNFNTWYGSIHSEVEQIWTIFRDLANILIIGIFVFIAISIILGLQEYGQRRLIARVIIVSILINFSFLFTIMTINASNVFATEIYTAILKMDPHASDADVSPGVGAQLATYMGLSSMRDTRNTLMRQYNSAGGFEAVFSHAFFLAVFAIGATGAFLYASLLLFARFILFIILLTLSAAAFATYLLPNWAESGWSRWWNSLLNKAFFAPIFMLFLLATVKIAKGLAGTGKIGSLGEFSTAPTQGAWDVLFIYLTILGIFFGGTIISSSMAGGIANRFAQFGLGSAAGGASALGAFAGRWGIGREFAKREHQKRGEASEALRDLEAARRDPNRRHEIPTLEKNYNKLLRQANFAGAQAKRTFDLRNTTPVGTLLKATGAGRITEGTKKNYADIAHSEAEKAARAGVEAAISQKGATAIAKERAKETYGDAEKEHEDAQQQVRDTRQRMRQIREEGERVAEQHEREARQAREHQQELERQHATATDEAERTRLQTQITTVGERIAAARRSAQNARERANNEVARMLPELKTLETKATLARGRLSDFNEEVKKETAAVLEGNRQFVGEVAKGFVGNKFQQTLYRAFGVGDTHMLHDAEAAAQARAQIKEKAEEKKKIDNYDKPAHAPAAPSGAAPAGGDHH